MFGVSRTCNTLLLVPKVIQYLFRLLLCFCGSRGGGSSTEREMDRTQKAGRPVVTTCVLCTWWMQWQTVRSMTITLFDLNLEWSNRLLMFSFVSFWLLFAACTMHIRRLTGMLAVGFSMGAMIWWTASWGSFGAVVSYSAAVILSAIAMGFGLAGLCLSSLFEGACANAEKAMGAILYFIAFICQCCTLVALAALPNCSVLRNCEVGGPVIMSIIAIILYFLSSVAVCVMPSNSNKRSDIEHQWWNWK